MLDKKNDDNVVDAYSLAFDLRTTDLNVEGGYCLIDLAHYFGKKKKDEDEGPEQVQLVYPRAAIDEITERYISQLQLKHVLIHRGCLNKLMTSNGKKVYDAVSLISNDDVKLVILDQYSIPHHDIKFNEETRAMLDKTPTRNHGGYGRGRGHRDRDSSKGWIN